MNHSRLVVCAATMLLLGACTRSPPPADAAVVSELLAHRDKSDHAIVGVADVIGIVE
jgi:hypothetical protein